MDVSARCHVLYIKAGENRTRERKRRDNISTRVVRAFRYQASNASGFSAASPIRILLSFAIALKAHPLSRVGRKQKR